MADAFEEDGENTVSIGEFLQDLEEQELVSYFANFYFFLLLDSQFNLTCYVAFLCLCLWLYGATNSIDFKFNRV